LATSKPRPAWTRWRSTSHSTVPRWKRAAHRSNPFNDSQAFDLERAWYFQEGKIMSPDDLSVGQHELTVRFSDLASGLDESDGITFFIDAAGTGACLND